MGTVEGRWFARRTVNGIREELLVGVMSTAGLDITLFLRVSATTSTGSGEKLTVSFEKLADSSVGKVLWIMNL